MEDDVQKPADKIIKKEIETEMRESYLDYAMSVIVARALPDARDGLKPVHRRILFAMKDMGMLHNKPYKKSARIVGETLGKYHPHGDSSVYDAMVRMVQEFSLRYPLVNGQGNFGSVDGDNAAAMRYTEARLTKIAEEMLSDIEKDTVKFVPNFDESLQEPSVLPSKFPNLLVNGSSGIAVGMATNIPPHNLNEICNGTIATIDNPDITAEELIEIVKGPDFPTFGIIAGTNGIKSAYTTGRGKILVKARTEIQDKRIIIHEIPYQVNKSMLIMQIADLVKNKTIIGISDLRDESDKEGTRVVIDLKKDANGEVILSQLLKHSRLQVTFGIIMLSLVNNEPKVLTLKEMITYFIEHRKEIVTRRTQYDLTKAEQKAHILQGLEIALNNLDPVIKLIKEADNPAMAIDGLINNYSLTKIQAQAILDMKLQRLTGLEQDKIKQDYKLTIEIIEQLKEILASEEIILNIIKDELLEIKGKYGDKRKTEIQEGGDDEIEIEDLIEKEDMVVTMTHAGYVKRLSLDTYKQQKRGGRGIVATGTKEEDFVEEIFIANTHSYLLFFSDKGKVYWRKVYTVPEGSRQSKGKAIVNLIPLEANEKINATIPVKEFNHGTYLVMATKKGLVKKTELKDYSRPREGGIKAITLNEGDELVNVMVTNGTEQLLIATKNGQAVKFNEKDARSVGRTSIGVRGVRLKGNDEVIGMVRADDKRTLFTVTENGYGKRTRISDYRLTSRGGSGVRNIICSDRNGGVVAVKTVEDNDQLMMMSKHGIAIRTPALGINVIGRNTQGVRVMRLGSGDKVTGTAKIIGEMDEEKKLLQEERKLNENLNAPEEVMDDLSKEEFKEEEEKAEQENEDEENIVIKEIEDPEEIDELEEESDDIKIEELKDDDKYA